MPTFREINKLAIPAILYSITEPLLGLVDTAVIGQMETGTVTEAQAGIGLSAGLIATLVWGLAQIRTAVSSLVSQYLGKNRIEEIKSLVPQSLLFSLFIGIVFWILTAYYFIPIAQALFNGKSESIMSYANEYYQIRALGLPFSLLIAGFFGVFRGYQNTSYAMIAAFVGGLVNVVLDLLLVKGWGSIPAMGVSGVAWASVIAQLVMVLVCIYFLYRKTPFGLNPGRKLNPEFGNMLDISGNMFIRTMALNVAFLLALRFANSYGSSTLAAYSIGIQIWLFSSFFIDGYSNAGNALSGKFLGANDTTSLRRLVMRLIKINLLVSVFLGLVYSIAYAWLGSWFTDDLAVIVSLNSFLWLVILAQPLNSIAFTMDGIFKGMGKARILRNVLIFGTFCVFIPVLLLSDYLQFKVFSIWLAFFAWMAFRSGSLLFVFFRTYKLPKK